MCRLYLVTSSDDTEFSHDGKPSTGMIAVSDVILCSQLSEYDIRLIRDIMEDSDESVC